MKTEFRITKRIEKNEWEPFAGTVIMKPIANINNGKKDLLITIKLKNQQVTAHCDGTTMTSEPETENGFINKLFKGVCYSEKDMLNQEKVTISFGDFPNGDAIIALINKDGKQCYSNTNVYYLKINNQNS